LPVSWSERYQSRRFRKYRYDQCLAYGRSGCCPVGVCWRCRKGILAVLIAYRSSILCSFRIYLFGAAIAVIIVIFSLSFWIQRWARDEYSLGDNAGTQALEVMLALGVFYNCRGRFTLHLTWLIIAALSFFLAMIQSISSSRRGILSSGDGLFHICNHRGNTHRSNIKRLLSRTENRFSLKSKTSGAKIECLKRWLFLEAGSWGWGLSAIFCIEPE